MKTIVLFFCIMLAVACPIQKLSAQNGKPYKDWVENKGNFNLHLNPKTHPPQKTCIL
jgi:hypothetical protein